MSKYDSYRNEMSVREMDWDKRKRNHPGRRRSLKRMMLHLREPGWKGEGSSESDCRKMGMQSLKSWFNMIKRWDRDDEPVTMPLLLDYLRGDRDKYSVCMPEKHWNKLIARAKKLRKAD